MFFHRVMLNGFQPITGHVIKKETCTGFYDSRYERSNFDKDV